MMNQQEELQTIFLKWFRHYGTRSMTQIRQSVTNLCRSYEFEGKGLYLIFFPLVRKGHIEFIGNETYQIAPGIVIYDFKAEVSAGINLNNEQLNQVTKQIGKFETDQFGVIRFKTTLKNVKILCCEIKCQFANSNIDHILSSFPKLSDVISGYPKKYLSESGFRFEILRHSWSEKFERIDSGIFKTSNDALVFYFKDEINCYELPSMYNNPDGWSIVETYQAVKEYIDFLFYDHEMKELKVKGISIPILIDRILRIPSYHFPDGAVNLKYETIYKNISCINIKHLNRIFGIKILTNHE